MQPSSKPHEPSGSKMLPITQGKATGNHNFMVHQCGYYITELIMLKVAKFVYVPMLDSQVTITADTSDTRLVCSCIFFQTSFDQTGLVYTV
jgi:hypothetical protein